MLTGGHRLRQVAVARLLREWGAYVVDADVLAREVVYAREPRAWRPSSPCSEPGVLAPDGSLDRAALAERVFADPDQLSRLEADHPPPGA